MALKLNGREVDLPEWFVDALIIELEGRGAIIVNPGGPLPTNAPYTFNRTPTMTPKTIYGQVEAVRRNADNTGDEAVVKWTMPAPLGGVERFEVTMAVTGAASLSDIFLGTRPACIARFDELWNQ